MTRKKKPTTSLVRSSAAEYLTFVAASGTGGVEAIYADENVWLSQKMMARPTTSGCRSASSTRRSVTSTLPWPRARSSATCRRAKSGPHRTSVGHDRQGRVGRLMARPPSLRKTSAIRAVAL